MKKKILSLAVAAGLSGVMAGAAHAAMHVNDKGLGEALIYPFYSAEGGNDTYIHVVNTTDYTKAVKVRFIEAHNSAEVLDFNLYLSPHDVWAAAVTIGENGAAQINTVDTSCTVPDLGQSGAGQHFGTKTELDNGKILRSQRFVNHAYVSAGPTSPGDGGYQGNNRTTQGYVEIIEMGQLDPNDGGFGEAAVHDASGIPNDRANAMAPCASLVAAWSTVGPNNVWRQEVNDEDGTGEATTDLLPWDGEDGGAAGGLWGYGVVLNVAQGTAVGYDAVAIDDFNYAEEAVPLHFAPGNNLPSLENADTVATIFNGSEAVDYVFATGAEAVSALFMSSTISNDFVTDPDLNATTDWVVTMPTKRFFVNQNPAKKPFTKSWSGSQKACEPVAITHWDREEAFIAPEDSSGFSPPQATGVDNELCTEVSIVQFGDTSPLQAKPGAVDPNGISYPFPVEYNDGWARMSFLPKDLVGTLPTGSRELVATSADPSTADLAFVGLPVVGFASITYQNLAPVEGSSFGANYSAGVTHKSEQLITAPTPTPEP